MRSARSVRCCGAAPAAIRLADDLAQRCVAIVTTGYCGLGPTIFRKHEGRLPMRTWFVLWPYLIGAHLARRIQRRASASQIIPNVWIGATPAPTTLMRCWISPRNSVHRVPRARTYMNIPVLDLTTPTGEQLRRAVRFIETQAHDGRICICCAPGYCALHASRRRTCCIAASPQAAEDAIAIVRRARPAVVLRREHSVVLADFASES